MLGRRGSSRLVALAALGLVVVTVAGAASKPQPARGTMLVSTTRSPDLHDELWVLDVRTGRRTNFSRNPTSDREPAVSPDGGLVAFTSDRGGREAVWVRRADGGGLRILAGPFAERPGQLVKVLQLRWSPDGERLAFLIDRRPGVWEVRHVSRGGGPSRRIAIRASDSGWTWAPDGRRVAVTHVDASGVEVAVYDLAGRRVWRIPGFLNGWSARGEVSVSDRGRVTVASSDGRVLSRVTGIGGFWSPDGRLLAMAPARSHGIRLVDPAGRVRMLSTSLSLDGALPVWAPDSRSLLARDRQFRLVRVTVAGRVTVLPQGGSPAAWAPDGALILASRTGVRLEGRGAPRRFALPRSGGPCPSGLQAIVWLDRDRVVYQAGHHGQQEGDVWIVDRAGRMVGRFLGSEAWEGTPVWSPNGNVAVYEHGDTLTHGGGCEGPYTPHLRLVEPDGAIQVLTQQRREPYDGSPRWSPNGTVVAFERGAVGGPEEFGIVTVDVRSSTERRRTTGLDHSLSWTADGTSIVFQRGNGADIRRLVVSTGVVSPVTTGRYPEAAPTVSLIAFIRDAGLWTARTDGSDARRLAAVQAVPPTPSFIRVSERPHWSPDGDRIALAERSGILVVDSDGRNARRIAAPGARRVQWSPDGRTLAFTAPVGNYSRGIFNSGFVARTELFVVPASGGKPTRLTHDHANVLGIGWRP